MGDLNILKSKAKINLNNKGLMINYMDFYIDRGRLSLSGDIHSHETKLWMTDLKDMEYQLDVEMSKLQIHDLVSVIRQPLDQGASLQAGKRSFNFDSKITALFSKYDFDKLDQFMAHVSDQPNKNIVDKWATVKGVITGKAHVNSVENRVKDIDVLFEDITFLDEYRIDLASIRSITKGSVDHYAVFLDKLDRQGTVISKVNAAVDFNFINKQLNIVSVEANYKDHVMSDFIKGSLDFKQKANQH